MENQQFRNKAYVKAIVEKIHKIYPGGTMKIMEVCGTHTMAISRYGLRSLMPKGLRLISGPGCPVCVTPTSAINAAISLSQIHGIVICTFGDMIRVPGTEKNLEIRKSEGSDIRVVYSPHDMLKMAQKEVEKEFVFISVGFETTTPGIALCVMEAQNRGLKNVSFLISNRIVIPAMQALCESEIQIHGFLCPGHVSTIIGTHAYIPIVEKFEIPCVIAGFEPVDMLTAVYFLVERISQKEVERTSQKYCGGVQNSYTRAVTEKGNIHALQAIDKVFEPVNAEWRGLGMIPQSGLALRQEFSHLDAQKKFAITFVPVPDPKGCQCGNVLKGLITPPECALFGKRCKPETPVGPCMVSTEGSCAAYYQYGER